MTEPDEALIWARDDLAGEFDVYKPYYAALIRRGREDASLSASARAYRAGQAASAERIKALEEAIHEAMRRLNEYADMTVDEWDDSVADGGIMAWMVIRQELKTVVVYRLDRALLKEADQ